MQAPKCLYWPGRAAQVECSHTQHCLRLARALLGAQSYHRPVAGIVLSLIFSNISGIPFIESFRDLGISLYRAGGVVSYSSS